MHRAQYLENSWSLETLFKNYSAVRQYAWRQLGLMSNYDYSWILFYLGHVSLKSVNCRLIRVTDTACKRLQTVTQRRVIISRVIIPLTEAGCYVAVDTNHTGSQRTSTHRQRQTDRQTDRQIDRQTGVTAVNTHDFYSCTRSISYF